MQGNTKFKGKKTVYNLKLPTGSRRLDPEQSKLPIVPREHHLGYYAMVAILTAGAIASWAFVTGGSIGVLVPVKYGICAAFFGCVIAYGIHGYMAVVYTRWGTDASVIGRSVWGHRGIYVLILGIGFPATYGWGSMPLIMLGRSAATVADSAGAPGILGTWQLWSFGALAIGLLITYYGTTVIDKISMIATPIIVILIVFICVVLLREYGIYDSFNTSPGDIPVTRHNYMVAVEIALGVGVSWIFLLSAYTKPALSENASYTPSVLGNGVAWAICCIAPMITSCMVDLSDPVEALAAIGGGYVIVWLVMLAFANFSSVMVNPYFLSCNLQSMFPKMKWKYCVLIQTIYAVAIIFPVFYDQFGVVISFIGLLEGPAGCIWALDFFLNKRINLRHCYAKGEQKKKSAYWYWHGFSVPAWVGLICGTAFGIWHYNPWTSDIKFEGLFDLFGAMLPASFIGTAVYFILWLALQKDWRRKLDMRATVDEFVAQKDDNAKYI